MNYEEKQNHVKVLLSRHKRSVNRYFNKFISIESDISQKLKKNSNSNTESELKVNFIVKEVKNINYNNINNDDLMADLQIPSPHPLIPKQFHASYEPFNYCSFAYIM